MSLYSSRVSILFIAAISVVVISARDWTQYELLGLADHNNFRRIHRAPPLELDLQMCNEAQAYAETLLEAGIFRHSPKEQRHGDGENLAFAVTVNYVGIGSVTEGVTNWYREVCSPGYNFDQPGNTAGTGHFTQLVWKSSTKLGIGLAIGTDPRDATLKAYYLVARYRPDGNRDGDYAQNVQRGDFNSFVCNQFK